MPAKRLKDARSPYLRQHADNPVDWYPWGPEALHRARAENKPIFVSIGYSSCHWCHVMERETFRDPEIADFLNRHFVSIKVDREERPDLDWIYVQAVVSMTGTGGWPLNVFLTPDGAPFYGGTYFPPEDRWGRPGFRRVLQALHEAWTRNREEVVAAAQRLRRALQEAVDRSPGQPPRVAALVEAARARLMRNRDRVHGGVGSAPKFPPHAALSFLLRQWKHTSRREVRDMLVTTLDAMALGGLHDHVGGGFHRYCVDNEWRIPHFEKMLYDNAQMALYYAEAAVLLGYPQYAWTARRIVGYLMRDMRAPEGAFCAAEDADSQGREGIFYTWSYEELEGVLGADTLDRFSHYFHVRPEGNFEDGRNHLYRDPRKGWASEAEERELQAALDRLFRVRSQRPRPFRDDKILTDWNGLAISALARAGAILHEEVWIEGAAEAAEFFRTRMWDRHAGLLYHRYVQGDRDIPGFLSDYMSLVSAFLDLHEVTGESAFLEDAVCLFDQARKRFWDEARGRFYDAPPAPSERIVPVVEGYDGAVPSGNALAVRNAVRLQHMTGDMRYQVYIDGIARYFGTDLETQPVAHLAMLDALDFAHGEPWEIVVVGTPTDPLWKEARAGLADPRLPDRVVVWVDTDRPMGNDLTRGKTAQRGRLTYYPCRSFSCQQPVTEIEELARLLGVDPLR